MASSLRCAYGTSVGSTKTLLLENTRDMISSRSAKSRFAGQFLPLRFLGKGLQSVACCFRGQWYDTSLSRPQESNTAEKNRHQRLWRFNVVSVDQNESIFVLVRPARLIGCLQVCRPQVCKSAHL